MGLRLIIEDYEGSTTVFPLGEGPITIGREESNTICLTEKNVSRQHARLTPDSTGWKVEDLESYNGVRVNGTVVGDAHVIHEGDLIQIGDYQLLLGDDTSTRATVDLGPNLLAAANEGGGAAAAALPVAAAQREAAQAGARLVEEPAEVKPVAAAASDYDDLELESQSGGGGKGLIVVALLAALGAGAWYFTAGPGAAGKADAGVASSASASETPDAGEDEAAEPADGETAAQASGEDPDAAAQETGDAVPPTGAMEDTEGSEPAGADDEPVEDEDGGEVDADAVDPEPVEPEEAEAEPEPEPAPAAATTKKKKKKKKTTAPAPAPTPEPAGASASELLADARKAQLSGSYSKAYSLAKKSYAASPSPDAAQVMGVAACKMGDEAKAKSAYGKLSGSKKSSLQSICAKSGIEL